jgi:hypothetical protein
MYCSNVLFKIIIYWHDSWEWCCKGPYVKKLVRSGRSWIRNRTRLTASFISVWGWLVIFTLLFLEAIIYVRECLPDTKGNLSVYVDSLTCVLYMLCSKALFWTTSFRDTSLRAFQEWAAPGAGGVWPSSNPLIPNRYAYESAVWSTATLRAYHYDPLNAP